MGGGTGTGGIPEFKMPSCTQRHFFKGHKWWCKHCRREVESQFREVCEAWWSVNTVCGSTDDEMFCACGCGGDDSRCNLWVACYEAGEPVPETHRCCD